MFTYKGVLFIILSTVCFTIMYIGIKYVNHLPTFELIFFRSIGSFLFGIFIIKNKKIPILGKNKKLLFLRGLVGVISISLFFRAMQIMPLGTVVSLRYISPFFVLILAPFFLKEKVTKWQWFFLTTAFIGVIILKRADVRLSLEGLIMVLIAAFFSALVYIIIRKIGRKEHTVVVINYFMGMASITGGVFCLFNWETPMGVEWFYLIATTIFGFLGQLFMTRALQITEANIIVPFKYSEVIFALLVGWLFFNEKHTSLSLFAIGIIILSLISNILVKKIKRQV